MDGFAKMTARGKSVSAALVRKSHPGRPATPFLRERILHSATELFAEQQFEHVLIDDVAAHAGVGKGSVYRQFGSKEELYAAVVIDGFAQLQREIRAALAGCTYVHERIATIVHYMLRFFWRRRQFFALLRDPEALPRAQERQYRRQRQDMSRLVCGVLNEGVQSGAIRPGIDTRIAAESLLGMMRGINRYGRDYTTPERAVDLVTEIFLSGCAVNGNSANRRRPGELNPARLHSKPTQKRRA
jgi:AcrR family transcriptional regulator